MKTTIDMPDAIFRRTKALARKRHVTMRDLITEGLLHVLESKAFWFTIRDAVYEDRGA